MPKFNDYPHVFSPYNIGKMELKNRLVFSPVVSGHATVLDGDVTDNLVDFIGACARTGVARVGIGATPVDLGRARDFFGCLSATRDTDIPGIHRLAEEAHRYDAKLSVELLHAGRIAQPSALAGRKAYVPWLAPDMDPDKFQQVDEAQMDEVVDLFRNAARRVAEADCDEILIHGAHGNFVSGFLSPATNQRDDQYGGSFENRIRFPLRLVKAIRDEVGSSINLEYRISQNEYAPNTITLEEVVEYLQTISGYIDSVHLSGGWIFDPNWIRKMMPSYCEPRCLNIDRTAIIHKKLDIPVIAVGNINTIQAAEDILAKDQADVVAMARSFIADMDFVKKAYRGEPELIRPCLRCIECASRPAVGGGVRCSVNPSLGRESKYSTITKADIQKKVLIIGGGPAGMQAAQTAAKRGHNVVLYEKEPALGGRLKEASVLFKKYDTHKKYLQWDIDETKRSGARIELGQEFTPEVAEIEKPDVIINASGGLHAKPNIPGIDNNRVITITDADLKLVPIGRTVIVLGGGISGLECAIQLAHDGHDVTIIDMLPINDLWREVMDELRSGLLEQKELYHVKHIDDATITSIEEDFIKYRKSDGTEDVIHGDTFVSSFGIVKNREFNLKVNDIMPEVYTIGDARQPKNIFQANMDAFNVAVEI